jgi:hypothetical protein
MLVTKIALRSLGTLALLAPLSAIAQKAAAPQPRHNVIIFVADGLRRGSVTAADMPTLFRLRTQGVDLQNSHAVYPTVTTANASAIATGHGLGDTGDFGNDLYPGFLLAQPLIPTATGSITPFLESDDILATLNSFYDGNYLGEPTLLSAAQAAGFNVAAIGKLGPTAIQNVTLVSRDQLGLKNIPDSLLIDDATGTPAGVPLPLDFAAQLDQSGLPSEAPQRTNGFAPDSPWSNGFSGNGATPGTRAANLTQEQWFTDVTTHLILPNFEKANKPFVLLFWSRDPDGTQHNQGDSFQNLAPGINGDTSRLALHNADHCLAQILDYLDQHPALKATTDVLVTSDHGFATISRRELDAANTPIGDPASALTYQPAGHDKPEPALTLPTGFLAIDLALFTHQRLFDPEIRATTGDSVYQQVLLSGETSQYPVSGNAILGQQVKHLDASDARLIIAANGGSDLLYVPSKDPAIVKSTIATLADLDYIGAIFADDTFCPTATSCPGALPLSSIGLIGSTHLPTPAIVVSFKGFTLHPGDLQSGIQITDTNLQEGQGNHGALARDQTWNNMAAIGPDFKQNFVDPLPVGNIDIAPTVAAILGINLPSNGKLTGRVLQEALAGSPAPLSAPAPQTLVSAPSTSGRRTLLNFQSDHGVLYLDRACMVTGDSKSCPD